MRNSLPVSPSVLFVCTGNVCRSPMAVALFQRLVEQRGESQVWRVASAGTWAREGARAAPEAQEALRELGLDMAKGHRAQTVTTELLQGSDLIITFEQGQMEALQVEFPQIKDRVFGISQIVGQVFDVADPHGGTVEDFREKASEIEGLLRAGMDRILELAAA